MVWADGTHCYLLERLLSGVRPDVVVEGGGAGEGAAAVSALEGPVAGVRHHVVPQLRRLREGLGAVATLVRPGGARRHFNHFKTITNHEGFYKLNRTKCRTLRT